MRRKLLLLIAPLALAAAALTTPASAVVTCNCGACAGHPDLVCRDNATGQFMNCINYTTANCP
jgi:hypothetical protein